MSGEHKVAGFLLGVCLGAVQFEARAQGSPSTERAAARNLGYAGVEAFQAGRFVVASEKLEKAYAVLPVPSLGLWSARALVKQDKLLEAADRYAEVMRLNIAGGDEAVQKKAQSDAHAELEATRAATPSVVIQLTGADASAVVIAIDGATVSSKLVGEATPLNPGKHRIEATWGQQHLTRQVTLQGHEQQAVPFVLAANIEAAHHTDAPVPAPETPVPAPEAPVATGSAPDAPGSTRGTLSWALVGAGATGIAVGAVTGVMVLSKRSSLDRDPACADDHNCPPAYSSKVSSYDALRTVSTVAFVAGGVLSASGIVLLLTAPRSGASQTSLYVSPSSVALRGQF